MKFNRLKNFVIIALAVTAVYQTVLLWLGSSAGHNFFYYFLSKENFLSRSENTEKTSVDPEKIIVGYGTKTFNVTYPGLFGNYISKTADNFILNVLKNKDEIYQEDTSVEKYIDKKCIVYDFGVRFSASEYMFGLGENIDLGIEFISRIIAVAGTDPSDVNRLYFVDEKNFKTAVVTSSDMRYNESMENMIKASSENDAEKLRYISTAQSGLYIFKTNVFVPQWTQPQLDYNRVQKQGIALKTKEEIEADLNTSLSGFFEGYSPLYSVDEEGVYILSSNSLVIKYYPNGIFEYYDYGQTKETKDKQTLSTAYYKCKEFLGQDKTLKTDLYLSDVYKSKGNELVFRFNYSVNDFPVILSEKVKEEINAEYAVEVVVENNSVKRYKRYAYDIFVNPAKTEATTVDFVNAMNKSITTMTESVNKIDDIVLGYYLSDDEDDGTLKWFIEIEDKSFVVNTQENIQE